MPLVSIIYWYLYWCNRCQPDIRLTICYSVSAFGDNQSLHLQLVLLLVHLMCRPEGFAPHLLVQGEERRQADQVALYGVPVLGNEAPRLKPN